MANREAEKRERREARQAAEAAAAKQATRERNLRVGGGALVVLVIAAVIAVVVAGSGGSSKGQAPVPTNLAPAFGSYASLPGVQNTPPPWNAADGTPLASRLKAIGLPQLGAEGTATHIHAHLDLFVDGKRQSVAQLIGIQPQGKFITILHTHDTSGIIHIESPDQGQTYSLGQFFAVWGLPLGPTGIGSLKTGGGKIMKMWVNGKPWTQDPTRLILSAHAEIVLAYGTAAQMPKTVPSKYSFPAGL